MVLNSTKSRACAVVLATALASTALSPSMAAPFPASIATVKNAINSNVIDVRWRGRGGGWIAGGIAAGLAIGAIAASRPYYYGPQRYYYDTPYYYAPPVVYEEPVYVAPPAPVYAAPAYAPRYAAPPAYSPPVTPNGPVRQCWVNTDRDRGLGYWQAC